MAPPLRKQPSRSGPAITTQNAAGPSTFRHSDALSDFQHRRIQRRLDDLERTNPTDIPASSFVPLAPTTSGNKSSPLPFPTAPIATGPPKKKQTGNVRKILLAKKSLKDWLEELPSSPHPPYVLAVAPPPPRPPRKICASCGYIGAYRCPRCGEWSCDRVCLEVHERDGGCGIGA